MKSAKGLLRLVASIILLLSFFGACNVSQADVISAANGSSALPSLSPLSESAAIDFPGPINMTPANTLMGVEPHDGDLGLAFPVGKLGVGPYGHPFVLYVRHSNRLRDFLSTNPYYISDHFVFALPYFRTDEETPFKEHSFISYQFVTANGEHYDVAISAYGSPGTAKTPLTYLYHRTLKGRELFPTYSASGKLSGVIEKFSDGRIFAFHLVTTYDIHTMRLSSVTNAQGIKLHFTYDLSNVLWQKLRLSNITLVNYNQSINIVFLKYAGGFGQYAITSDNQYKVELNEYAFESKIHPDIETVHLGNLHYPGYDKETVSFIHYDAAGVAKHSTNALKSIIFPDKEWIGFSYTGIPYYSDKDSKKDNKPSYRLAVAGICQKPKENSSIYNATEYVYGSVLPYSISDQGFNCAASGNNKPTLSNAVAASDNVNNYTGYPDYDVNSTKNNLFFDPDAADWCFTVNMRSYTNANISSSSLQFTGGQTASLNFDQFQRISTTQVHLKSGVNVWTSFRYGKEVINNDPNLWDTARNNQTNTFNASQEVPIGYTQPTLVYTLLGNQYNGDTLQNQSYTFLSASRYDYDSQGYPSQLSTYSWKTKSAQQPAQLALKRTIKLSYPQKADHQYFGMYWMPKTMTTTFQDGHVYTQTNLFKNLTAYAPKMKSNTIHYIAITSTGNTYNESPLGLPQTEFEYGSTDNNSCTTPRLCDAIVARPPTDMGVMYDIDGAMHTSYAHFLDAYKVKYLHDYNSANQTFSTTELVDPDGGDALILGKFITSLVTGDLQKTWYPLELGNGDAIQPKNYYGGIATTFHYDGLNRSTGFITFPTDNGVSQPDPIYNNSIQYTGPNDVSITNQLTGYQRKAKLTFGNTNNNPQVTVSDNAFDQPKLSKLFQVDATTLNAGGKSLGLKYRQYQSSNSYHTTRAYFNSLGRLKAILPSVGQFIGNMAVAVWFNRDIHQWVSLSITSRPKTTNNKDNPPPVSVVATSLRNGQVVASYQFPFPNQAGGELAQKIANLPDCLSVTYDLTKACVRNVIKAGDYSYRSTEQYDERGFLTKVTQPAPDDEGGNDRKWVSTQYTYTPLGQVASETQGINAGLLNQGKRTFFFRYNLMGQMVCEADAAEPTLSGYNTDACMEPTSFHPPVLAPHSHLIRVTRYNQADLLASIANSDRQMYQYHYFQGTRSLATVTQPNGEIFIYTYNRAGEVSSVIGPKNDSIDYLYQSHSYTGHPATWRLASIFKVDGGNDNKGQSYSYYPDGALKSEDYLNGIEKQMENDYSYSPYTHQLIGFNSIKAKNNTVHQNSGLQQDISYQYNQNNQLQHVDATLKDRKQSYANERLVYQRDAYNRVTEKTTIVSGVQKGDDFADFYGYDDEGILDSEAIYTHTQHLQGLVAHITMQYFLSGMLHLRKVEYNNGQALTGASPWIEADYHYSALGQLESLSNSVGDSGGDLLPKDAENPTCQITSRNFIWNAVSGTIRHVVTGCENGDTHNEYDFYNSSNPAQLTVVSNENNSNVHATVTYDQQGSMTSSASLQDGNKDHSITLRHNGFSMLNGVTTSVGKDSMQTWPSGSVAQFTGSNGLVVENYPNAGFEKQVQNSVSTDAFFNSMGAFVFNNNNGSLSNIYIRSSMGKDDGALEVDEDIQRKTFMATATGVESMPASNLTIIDGQGHSTPKRGAGSLYDAWISAGMMPSLSKIIASGLLLVGSYNQRLNAW